MWKNSLYNTIGGIIRLGLGLISVPLLTRNLGIEKYGLYSATSSILNIAVFSEWTIAASITVYLSTSIPLSSGNETTLEKTNNLSIAALYVIILALITSVLLYCSIPWLLLFFKNLNLVEKKVLKEVIQIGSWTVCARLFIQFFIGILQANKEYGMINILSTFLTAVSSVLALYISFTSQDILMIQRLQLVAVLIALILYYTYCLYLGYLPRAYFMKPTINQFINLSRYGVRTLVTALGSTLFSQFDRLIILRLFGVEWAGIYSVITTIANQINVVSSMPIQPLLPVLSEYYQKISKNKAAENILIKAFVINTALVLICGSGIIFFSSEIVKFIFKDSQFSIFTIRRCLIAVTIAYSIYSFNAVGYFTLLAIQHERFVRNIVLISGVFSLCVIYILSANFGVIGGCFGNLGYSLTLLLNMKCINSLNISNRKLFQKIAPLLIVTFFVICLSLLFNSLFVNVILYLLFTFYLLYTLTKAFL